MSPSGVALCVSSAAAFGAMGIFGKLAFDEGATTGTLLATRFVVAAALFWLGVAASPTARRDLRRLAARDVALAVGLGAAGYGAQAAGYFTALGRIDASLLSLLVYTFPVIVAVAAVALGREPARRRTAVALVLTSGGLALVLRGAAAGGLDPVGTALGLGTAGVYSAYVLVSERLVQRVSPLTLSTLVCTGAAASLTVGAGALGELRPGRVSGAGFGWLGLLAVVSTVGAVALFFAGLARVGPTVASIVSTVEPLVAVGLAVALLHESLGPVQLAGAGLVLGAVLAVVADPADPAGSAEPAGPAGSDETGPGLTERISPEVALTVTPR
jgi:drug/metabolite transporter (DMT)-like permease